MARKTADLFVEVDLTQDLGYLIGVSCQLMVEALSAGNTAQRLVGLILEIQSSEAQTIEGTMDAASAINTTSKKAGDLIIYEEGGDPRVIEVTQKAFDSQRMEDSYDSVRAMDETFGTETREVVVLCREDDVPGSAEKTDDHTAVAIAYFGSASRLDLTFEFVDIFEWVATQLSTMTESQRLEYHQQLSQYVADPNTSSTVKKVWAKRHDSDK